MDWPVVPGSIAPKFDQKVVDANKLHSNPKDPTVLGAWNARRNSTIGLRGKLL